MCEQSATDSPGAVGSRLLHDDLLSRFPRPPAVVGGGRSRYNRTEGIADGGDAMGIRFYCPNGHKLNVKDFQAGRTGICPFCGVKMQIPLGKHPTKLQTAADGTDKARAPRRWPLTTATATHAQRKATPPRQADSAIASLRQQSATVPDPLAEAGDVVWYVRPPSGGQFGPAAADIMRTGSPKDASAPIRSSGAKAGATGSRPATCFRNCRRTRRSRAGDRSMPKLPVVAAPRRIRSTSRRRRGSNTLLICHRLADAGRDHPLSHPPLWS